MVIIPLVDYRMTLRCRSNAAQGNKKDKCKPGRDWKALMSLYKSLRLHLKHWVQFLAAPVEGEKKKDHFILGQSSQKGDAVVYQRHQVPQVGAKNCLLRNRKWSCYRKE